jgi:hypothetical protein
VLLFIANRGGLSDQRDYRITIRDLPQDTDFHVLVLFLVDSMTQNPNRRVLLKHLLAILFVSLAVQILLFEIISGSESHSSSYYDENALYFVAKQASILDPLSSNMDPNHHPPSPSHTHDAPQILTDDDARQLMLGGCFVVQDLCYSPASSPQLQAQQRHFFYKTIVQHPSLLPLQPKLIVRKGRSSGITIGTWTVEAAVGPSPTPSETKDGSEYFKNDETSCATSPIPNHFILHSKRMNMIMEFYLRVMAPLYYMLRSIPWWRKQIQSPDIQFYLDFPELSSSHSIFMEAFSSHPVKLFQDLVMVGEGGVSAVTNTNTSSSCTCLPRVVFCGYSHVAHPQAKEEEIEKRSSASRTQPTTIPPPMYLNLQPSATVGWTTITFGYLPYRQFWHELQTHLRRSMVNQNVVVLPRIQQLRELTIGRTQPSSQPKEKNATTRITQDARSKRWWDNVKQRGMHPFTTGSSNEDPLSRPMANTTLATSSSLAAATTTSDWKLIGFSQRLGRRRWLNLSSTLQHCNDLWNNTKYKMACIEVNLDLPESRENPIHQVVLHGGLSALIGVHGSQQTHAVWMPPHSYVLELLPYLWAKHGRWTQLTHIPTMNGYMLQDTDINHLGHPLDYKSVPNCSLPMYTQGGSRDQNVQLSCNDDKDWSDRDFEVEWDIVERFIQDFVLEPVPRTCNEFEAKSRNDFVLYNVACLQEDSIGVVLNNLDYDSRVASVVAADRKENKHSHNGTTEFDDGDSRQYQHQYHWVHRQYFRSRASFQNLQLQKKHFPVYAGFTERDPLQNIDLKRKKKLSLVLESQRLHPQLKEKDNDVISTNKDFSFQSVLDHAL